MARDSRLKNWAATLGLVFVFIGVPFPPTSQCAGVGAHGVEAGNWWLTGFYVLTIQYKQTTEAGIETCTMGIGWYVWVPLGVLLLGYGLYRGNR
jgi:hypothetical protein